jgi:hypothetical protein
LKIHGLGFYLPLGRKVTGQTACKGEISFTDCQFFARGGPAFLHQILLKSLRDVLAGDEAIISLLELVKRICGQHAPFCCRRQPGPGLLDLKPFPFDRLPLHCDFLIGQFLLQGPLSILILNFFFFEFLKPLFDDGGIIFGSITSNNCHGGSDQEGREDEVLHNIWDNRAKTPPCSIPFTSHGEIFCDHTQRPIHMSPPAPPMDRDRILDGLR